MSDTTSAKSHPVLAPFHQTDPKTGEPVFYDPAGDYNPDTGQGWAGAKKTYRAAPGDDVTELTDAGLIGAPAGEKSDDKAKPASATKEN